MCYLLVAVYVVSFEQSAYSINESSEIIQPVLVLNASPSVNLTVEVITSPNTAKGK